MKVDDMHPEMREAHLAGKAAQKHAQRLAVRTHAKAFSPAASAQTFYIVSKA